MALDFSRLGKRTFKVFWLVLCPKCGKTTEYIAKLPEFPCSYCNPACYKRGQHAKFYARRFEPVQRPSV